MTRASTPGSLSTSTALVCRSMSSATSRASNENHALFRDRALRLVLGAEQHLVVGGARGDHREAVLGLIDRDIEDDGARRLDHLADRVVKVGRILDAQPERAKGLGELDEIRQGGSVALGIAAAMQQFLP